MIEHYKQIIADLKLIGFTQYDLAARLGTSQNRINRMARGQADLSLLEICKGLDGLYKRNRAKIKKQREKEQWDS